jgi:hypothetical protein
MTRRVGLGIPSGDGNDLRLCFIGSANKRLAKAFVEVINLLCERRAGRVYEHSKQLFPVGYVLKEVGLFDKDTPPKLRELWEAIDAAVEAAYAHGKDSGANIIKRLASGDATINEFNKETLSACPAASDGG